MAIQRIEEEYQMTKIFNTYEDFLKRENKTINGVSPEFAEKNPNFENDNEMNKGCWDCCCCYKCSYCSDCYGCFYCFRCFLCSDCSLCSLCSRCSGCFEEEEKKEGEEENIFLNPPKIKNIHATVLAAASRLNALGMSTWHTCDTTHCRAGWVVTLAGEEGKKLEAQTSTMFAAMMIYKASSPIRVPPTRFFEKNEVAMADMKRCADEEKAI